MSTTEDTIKREAIDNLAGSDDQQQPTADSDVSTTEDNTKPEVVDNLAGSDDQQPTTNSDVSATEDNTKPDAIDNLAGSDDQQQLTTTSDLGSPNDGNSNNDGQKHVDVRPGEDCRGEDGAEDNFVFHDLGHWKIDGFNAQEGDVLDFTAFGLSRDQLASQITKIHVEADNFIVNFGDDVSITLAGVKPDQIDWDDINMPGDDRGDDGKGGHDHGGKDDHGGKGGHDHGGKDDHGGMRGDDRNNGGKDDHGGKDDRNDDRKDDSSGGMRGDDRNNGGKDDHGGKDDRNDDQKDDSSGGGMRGDDRNNGGKDDHGGRDDHGDKGGRHHKHVDARPGEDCRGEDGADNFVFHDLGHWKIDGFNGQEGDMLDFTEYGLSRDQIASHITKVHIEADNFIVNFGDDVSITLVGQPPAWENVTTVEG
ncbi:hypothetical protein [Nitrosomonas communis]|uniref:hypothetical protein n=1 Tax=Nitrosomonas communis TaxID=44574 RepID=UPI0026ED8E48|nr:hypothetical protein [Nitrosomonas communis]MCO6426502.1 hypothetical protein [Nitrosomonas communis]